MMLVTQQLLTEEFQDQRSRLLNLSNVLVNTGSTLLSNQNYNLSLLQGQDLTLSSIQDIFFQLKQITGQNSYNLNELTTYKKKEINKWDYLHDIFLTFQSKTWEPTNFIYTIKKNYLNLRI